MGAVLGACARQDLRMLTPYTIVESYGLDLSFASTDKSKWE